MSCTRTQLTQRPSQGLRAAGRGACVRTHAVASPVSVESVPVPGKEITKDDIGIRATQQELDKYLSSYVSSPVERVKYISPEHISGQIPKDLRGTLLRNGPGNFDYGTGEPNSGNTARLSHPFEGDGLLFSFAFEEDGKVFMRKKFARTKCLRDEMSAGQLLYKGVFAVGSPDGGFHWPFDFSNLRKPSNTGVIHWAGNVLALNEGDLPFLLDTELNSKGSSTLGLWSEKQFQSAHYRVTEEPDGSKRLCTFGFESGTQDFPATIMELDEAGDQSEVLLMTRVLGWIGFFHDFLVSPNYYIFVENPMRMDYMKLLTEFAFGKSCLVECLKMDTNRPQKIHLVPRPGKAHDGDAVTVCEASCKFTFHQVNAWETDSGAVVLDIIGKDFNQLGGNLKNLRVSTFEKSENLNSVRRVVAQPGSGNCKEYDLRDGVLRWRNVELPANPPSQYTAKPHDAIFAMINRDTPGVSGIHQSVVKIKLPHEMGATQPWDPSMIDFEEYYPGDGRYCLEPFFVPKPDAEVGETFTGNDGYILVHVNDLRVEGRERTCLEILDASDIAAGPLAVIDLQELIPPGLHGYWSESCFGPTENETELPWENDIRFNL